MLIYETSAGGATVLPDAPSLRIPAAMDSPIHVRVRCYAELNDALPEHRRYREFDNDTAVSSTVSALLTSLGVPEKDVDLILCNGESVPTDHVLRNGDRLSVYPVFESFDVSGQTRVRDQPLRMIRFVADVHLGSLARYLRMLGFDTAYRSFADPASLITLSLQEHRTLLSRSSSLVADRRLTHAMRILSPDPRRQLIEVLHRLDLVSSILPFSRCIACNDPVVPVERAEVLDRLPESIKGKDLLYRKCRRCDRIYWEGSHTAHMREFIRRVIAEAAQEGS